MDKNAAESVVHGKNRLKTYIGDTTTIGSTYINPLSWKPFGTRRGNLKSLSFGYSQ
jgi:hypothetical protein